jgi:Zn-dependent peptidase ImmA (M78 family)/DNA-binding XRE family transcriptional regulator
MMRDMMEAHQAIAANLRRHRELKGWTQAQLAQAAGISRLAYRNIETRKAQPQPRTLHALATALGVRVQELLVPAPQLRHVRFRSYKRLNSREQVLATVARKLADFNELEELLGAQTRPRIGGVELAPSGLAGSERGSRAAALVRKRFGLDAEEPIRDLCGLLEANGIKVLLLEVASDAFFGLSVAAEEGGPAIIVNTWERISVERQIFTAAHELGHLVLHLDTYDVEQGREESGQELEADTFAACFLMPESVFQREWDETAGLAFVDRVLKVKRMFRVSYKTVLYRLASRSPEGFRLYGRFQSDYRERTGHALRKADEPEALRRSALRSPAPEALRSREPDVLLPSDFTGDRLSALVRQAVEREEISLARAAELLDCSLEEMRRRVASWVE